MFYELNDDQKAFRKKVREIYEREVTPLVEESERKEAFPVQLFPILGGEHLLCLRCPKKYGGPGLDKISECITVEELNRICVGIGASIMVQGGLATDPILHFGSEELKRKYLSPAVRGEKIGAFALTEPNAGSDASGIRTTAVKHGEGYRLNGPKTFITNGTICDFATVAAYTDPARRGKGINLFVVERQDPGFSVTKKLRKLGNHSADTAELAFDDCYVPKERMLGEQQGGGLEQLEETLKSGRLTYGARSTGVGQAAFDAILSYVKKTQRHSQPLSKSQAIRFVLAEMAMSLEAIRYMTYRGAWLFDQGMATMKDASIVKLFCSETVQGIVQKAMAIQKEAGLMMDNPVQRFLRDGRLNKIPEGTSEVQHLVIAGGLGL
ncbi:MAG TPA: acyl-CoA dehydrogenase family protein [Thermodesulfobacteriota bacterium]|nr:acyl-CoA dehydrogenase family protein [Thermodesulfobacteriota bacterium]